MTATKNHDASSETTSKTVSFAFDRYVPIGFLIFMVVTTAIYIARSYSPFPIADMWDGNITFLNKFLEQPSAALIFEQHNEHRIVWTRLLFLIDEFVFNDEYLSLYLANFVLVTLFAGLVITSLRVYDPGLQSTRAVALVGAGLVYALCQTDNLASPFQSQFFLVYLLPFAAYCSWSRFCARPNIPWAVAVVAFLSASSVSMANGALATLPLIVIAILTKRKLAMIAALTVLQIVIYLAFTIDYVSEPIVPLLRLALWSGLFPTVLYTVTLLGSALGPTFAPYVGLILAVGMIFTIASIANKYWRSSMELPLPAGAEFVALGLFVVVSALSTAVGRAHLGIASALASRYTTPSICVILAALLYVAVTFRVTTYLRVSVYVLVLLFAVGQLQFLGIDESDEFFTRAATISAIQHTPDEKLFKKHVYPFGVTQARIDNSIKNEIGVFGTAPYEQMQASIGRAPTDAIPDAKCAGRIEATETIDGTVELTTGWIRHSASQEPYDTIALVQDGKVLGYGLTGYLRDDVARRRGIELIRSGFWVYTDPSFDETSPFSISFVDHQSTCSLQVN